MGGMKTTMSHKEAGRLRVIEGALAGKYTNRQAALKLGVSVRQIQKLKKKVREQGDAGIIHGNSGRSPKNATDEALKERIVALQKTPRYRKINFTYFKELLAEQENIEIGYRTLHDLLNANGIQSCKKHRPGGKRYRRRECRARFGELLQTDATPYDWFGIGERVNAHGFLDDATGDLVGLYFCENECQQGYNEAFRQVLVVYGIPDAIYADRTSNFFVNKKNEENWTPEEQLAGKILDKTQFGRIAEKLGVTLIPAGSPQAKGKIEKLWDTLQGRLPTWLELHDIHTIEQANEAAPQIMAWFNDRFGHAPRDTKTTSFSPLPKNYNLDILLSCKHERKTDNCGCFSYQNIMFQVESKKPIVRKQIVFLFSEKIGFKVLYEKHLYPVKLLDYDERDGLDRLPKVTQRLLYAAFFRSTKDPSRYPTGG
jgi:transposase